MKNKIEEKKVSKSGVTVSTMTHCPLFVPPLPLPDQTENFYETEDDSPYADYLLNQQVERIKEIK